MAHFVPKNQVDSTIVTKISYDDLNVLLNTHVKKVTIGLHFASYGSLYRLYSALSFVNHIHFECQDFLSREEYLLRKLNIQQKAIEPVDLSSTSTPDLRHVLYCIRFKQLSIYYQQHFFYWYILLILIFIFELFQKLYIEVAGNPDRFISFCETNASNLCFREISVRLIGIDERKFWE